MAIRRSTASQTTALIGDLASADVVKREAAIARLAIAGSRVVDPLLQALPNASAAGKTGILRALERIAEARSLPAAITLLASDETSVVIAAIGAVRPQLRTDDPGIADQALVALTTLALDDTRIEAVRVAAIDALSDLGPEVIDSLRERLRSEEGQRIRRAAGLEGPAATDVEAAAARLEAAVRAPGEEPDALRRLLIEAGDQIALSTLHDLVLAFRGYERSAAEARTKSRWEAARAAAHAALAQRGSRLALFDLRDTLADAAAASDEFVAAAALIGDASCLEPLASAWRRSRNAESKTRIERAAQAIVSREGLTRRHAVVKRLIAHVPETAGWLLPLTSRER